MEPLVSVVMPTYNSSKYIREAIDSIIVQTFSNWELLVMDGHSSDGTVEIVKEYEKIDSRIKLVFDEGQGIGAALNQGCSLAQGEYIARMDADDVAMNNRFEVEYNYLIDHIDVDVVSCTAKYIDEDGIYKGLFFPYTWQYNIRRKPTCILHPGVMMRKKSFQQAGGYPPIKRAEDLMLWLKILQFGRIVVLSEPLMSYRIAGDALSNLTTEFFNKNVVKYWRYYISKGLSKPEVIDEINSFVKKNITSEPVKIERIKNPEMRLFKYVSMFVNSKNAIRIVLLFKNIYGLFR